MTERPNPVPPSETGEPNLEESLSSGIKLELERKLQREGEGGRRAILSGVERTTNMLTELCNREIIPVGGSQRVRDVDAIKHFLLGGFYLDDSGHDIAPAVMALEKVFGRDEPKVNALRKILDRAQGIIGHKK